MAQYTKTIRKMEARLQVHHNNAAELKKRIASSNDPVANGLLYKDLEREEALANAWGDAIKMIQRND